MRIGVAVSVGIGGPFVALCDSLVVYLCFDGTGLRKVPKIHRNLNFFENHADRVAARRR